MQPQIIAGREALVTESFHGFNTSVSVDLDGRGEINICTGIGFLDHLLTLFARYGQLNLSITCNGDLATDDHHTVDDVAISLGTALGKAIASSSQAIFRMGSAIIPMDECLGTAAVDICGRSSCVFRCPFQQSHLGTMSTQNISEFVSLMAQKVPMVVIVKSEFGTNDHHVAEAAFKALGRAFHNAKTMK